MNIKLHDVINSLAGMSGLAVVRAIIAGERSPEALLALCDQQIVRSKDIALGGFYRRMAARRGGLIATMALARKLAAWYWRVMGRGRDEDFSPPPAQIRTCGTTARGSCLES